VRLSYSNLCPTNLTGSTIHFSLSKVPQTRQAHARVCWEVHATLSTDNMLKVLESVVPLEPQLSCYTHGLETRMYTNNSHCVVIIGILEMYKVGRSGLRFTWHQGIGIFLQAIKYLRFIWLWHRLQFYAQMNVFAIRQYLGVWMIK
jgi:hypothetical protein